MRQKLGEYQLNHFRRIQQKSSGGGGVHFTPPPPTQTLISLNVEIIILQPLQPALPPLHLSQP